MKIRKIERLQSSLSHWRTKYSQNVKECSARNALLTEEKNKIQGHFQQLKVSEFPAARDLTSGWNQRGRGLTEFGSRGSGGKESLASLARLC